MKKKITIIIMTMLLSIGVKAQEWSLSTSGTMWATATINAEIGYILNKHVTLHLPVTYNPFVFGENSRFQRLTIMPGARYWMSKSHLGVFASAYAIASRYHVGGWIKKRYRYDGKGFGIGMGCGYSWIISKRLNIECEGGLGLIYANHDKCGWEKNSKLYSHDKGIKLIPTKLNVNVIYFF